MRFKVSNPGDGFQDRYRGRQRSSGGRFSAAMIVSIVGGVLLVLGGSVAVPVP